MFWELSLAFVQGQGHNLTSLTLTSVAVQGQWQDVVYQPTEIVQLMLCDKLDGITDIDTKLKLSGCENCVYCVQYYT